VRGRWPGLRHGCSEGNNGGRRLRSARFAQWTRLRGAAVIPSCTLLTAGKTAHRKSKNRNPSFFRCNSLPQNNLRRISEHPLKVYFTLKPFDPEAENHTLGKLAVRHFRCFERFETEFAPGMNFIIGPNARGKTSLLEAACILLRLQSPRVTKLAAIIQHERRGFAVDGYFSNRHLQFYFSPERKKLVLDEVEQKSAHEYLRIGRLVYFSNSDINIVRGAGEVRRRFLDFIAAQRERTYREALRNYERAVRSRNLLLKAGSPRWREIEAFNGPIVSFGEFLTKARGNLISELQPLVNEAHMAITGAKENVQLQYQPGSGSDLANSLASARDQDTRLRQTTVGPHRDDMPILLNGQSLDFASEGQQRTLVLALKVGAARLIETDTGGPPLLLLDDIFGELDPARRNALLEALPANAQKLITSTHLDWMASHAESRILI
jgi:DNA replication and repair protein RecF